MGELHQSTLDTSLGPAYTRNNTPDPWGGFEGTCVLVTGKTQVAQVWIQFASWNVGSLSRKADEIAVTLKRCCIDVCSLQELRWKKGDW